MNPSFVNLINETLCQRECLAWSRRIPITSVMCSRHTTSAGTHNGVLSDPRLHSTSHVRVASRVSPHPRPLFPCGDHVASRRPAHQLASFPRCCSHPLREKGKSPDAAGNVSRRRSGASAHNACRQPRPIATATRATRPALSLAIRICRHVVVRREFEFGRNVGSDISARFARRNPHLGIIRYQTHFLSPRIYHGLIYK